MLCRVGTMSFFSFSWAFFLEDSSFSLCFCCACSSFSFFT